MLLSSPPELQLVRCEGTVPVALRVVTDGCSRHPATHSPVLSDPRVLSDPHAVCMALQTLDSPREQDPMARAAWCPASPAEPHIVHVRPCCSRGSLLCPRWWHSAVWPWWTVCRAGPCACTCGHVCPSRGCGGRELLSRAPTRFHCLGSPRPVSHTAAPEPSSFSAPCADPCDRPTDSVCSRGREDVTLSLGGLKPGCAGTARSCLSRSVVAL